MKKSIYAIALSMLAFAANHFELKAQAITFDNAVELGNQGPGSADVMDLETDAQGNLYAVGQFNKTMDFDITATHRFMNAKTNKLDKSNGFIAKYDSLGNMLVAHPIGGYSNYCFISAMALDHNDNIIVVGGFRDSAFVDIQNPAIPIYATSGGTLNLGGFLAQYDSEFNLIWVKVFEVVNEAALTDLEVDSQNYIYLGGQFSHTFDIDFSESEQILSSYPDGSNQSDLLLAKYDNTGNFQWAHSIGGDVDEKYGDMTINSEDKILYGSTYREGVYIDETTAIPGTSSSLNADFIIVSEFDSNGVVNWHKVITSTTGSIRIMGMDTDSDDNIFFTGDSNGNVSVEGTTVTLSGNPKFYIISMTPEGVATWAKNSSSSINSTSATIQLDDDSNIYITGTFLGTMDADFDAGTTSITSSPSTAYNYFIASYTSTGAYRWIEKIPTTGTPWLVLGEQNDVWMTGNFEDPTDFDPTAGINNISVPLETHFITKYSSIGVYEMSGAIVGSGGVKKMARAVKTNHAGDVLVAGMMSGDLDFDHGPDELVLQTSASYVYGDTMCYVASYAADGSLNWAFPIRGDLAIMGLDVDSQDNIYITGHYTGYVDFNPSATNTGPASSNGSNAIFLAKYNSLGELIWVKGAGGTNNDRGMDVIVDHSDNLIVTGMFADAVDFDMGTGVFTLTAPFGAIHFFVGKYDVDGNLIWVFNGAASLCTDLAVDANNNIYTTGYFRSFLNPKVGSGFPVTYAAGFGNGNNNDYDYFLAKYDSLGAHLWNHALGSVEDNKLSSDVCVDANNNVLWCGTFENYNDTVDIHPDDNIEQLIANSSVLAKFNPDGDFTWGIGVGKLRYGCIDVDSNGNVTMASKFGGTMDLDPSSEVYNVTNNSGYSLLHSRYSSEGTFEAAQVYNNTGWVTPYDLEVDANNKVQTVGAFLGVINLNPAQPLEERFFNPYPSELYDIANGFLLTSTQEDFEYELPPPNALFQTTTNQVCQNVCIHFDDNSEYSPTSWNWSFPGASPAFSTEQNPQNICYANAGQYDVHLIATNAFGSDTTTLVNYVTIYSNPLIVVSSDAEICASEDIELTASGGESYTWSPDETLSNTSGETTTASPTVTTTYMVEGSNENCTSMDEVTITVIALPAVDAGDDTGICIGESIELNATGASEFTWSADATLSNTQGASTTASPVVTTTYTVTGTAGNCSAMDDIIITVNEFPNVELTDDAADICLGDGIFLEATGATTYTWSPAGTLSNTTGANTTATPLETTDYIVSGTTNGCTSTDAIIVTVFPLPPNPIITLTDGVLQSTAAVVYQWYFNGAPISGADEQTYAPTQSGNYTVLIIDDNGCSAVSVAYNFTDVAEQLHANSTLTIYPNPITDVLNVHSTTAWANAHIAVYDAQGRMVGETTQTIATGSNAIGLDIIGLPSGIYTLEISDGKRVEKVRWVKATP
ncbi:MAG: T9SS type A sorting domain-containing protein [Flavobacteriales bacterium]